MAALDAVLMGVGVFLLAVSFKTLTGNFTTASSLWLANGFALGLLLTAPRTRWPLLLAIGVLAGAASAFYLHANPAVIPWIALFNGLEVLVAAVAVSGTVQTAADLTSRWSFLRFLGGAALLGPASLVIALAIFYFFIGSPLDLAVAQRIMVGHGLGIAVMTPVVLALRNGELRQYLKPGNIMESLLTLALVTASARWCSSRAPCRCCSSSSRR